MKIFPCVQGSDEWKRLRMGKICASEFETVIQPKRWEPTKGETRRAQMIRMLTELILDTPLASVSAAAMEHGHEAEPAARASYELLRGCEVEECGFATNDEETIGASLDGIVVGANRAVELKSPFKPEVHVGYMSDPNTLKDEYWVQTQGQLYLSKYEATDLVSYFQGLDMVIVEIHPHAEFQAKLDAALKSFVADFALLVERAKDKGWIKEAKAKPALDHSKDFLNDEDVELILKHAQLEGSPASS